MSIEPRSPARGAPARPRAREARGSRTRERVLETATRLLAERGYSGTTISALSKASGVLPASIYWHFGSKEGLVGAVIDRAAEQLFADLERTVAEERRRAGEDAGLAPFRSLHRTLLGSDDFRRLLLLVALERRDAHSEASAALRRVRGRVLDFLAGALADVLPLADPERAAEGSRRLAELIVVTMDGLFVARQIAEAPEQELERLRAVVERSIAATAEELVREGLPTESVASGWGGPRRPEEGPR